MDLLSALGRRDLAIEGAQRQFAGWGLFPDDDYEATKSANVL